MPPTDDPKPEGEEEKGEPPSQAQTPTEMIDRNRFLLHQLQGKIEEVKKAIQRKPDDPDTSDSSDTEASPDEILEEARAQLEKLQDAGPQPHTDPVRSEEGKEESQP